MVMSWALRTLTSQRNQFAQPLIAQEKAQPDQHTENDGEVKRIADTHMRRGRSAEIPC
jgi:hypothetical protein